MGLASLLLFACTGELAVAPDGARPISDGGAIDAGPDEGWIQAAVRMIPRRGRPARPSDAGPSDAGPSDAGTDAGPGDAPSDSGAPGAVVDAGTDAGASSGVDSLGPLPAELAGLRWPEPPRITREVTVSTLDRLAAEIAVSGTRVRVAGLVTTGGVTVRANDVEILADERSSLGSLSIARGVSRVHVAGGSWTGIVTAIPATFVPTVEYRSEWMVTDVLFEGLRVRSTNMAFEIRGRRIAIVRTRADATRYSVWCGDTGPMQSEDMILHDNVFVSEGPEATVRFVQVLRMATIGNTLSNTLKHNYRVHGRSDLAYAADNLLIGTGVMLGRMPGDDLGRVWFDDNVYHHTAPDLFNPDAGIDVLRARRNIAYTNVWSCFYCGTVQPGWDVSGNVIRPYEPPPPF